MTNDHDQCIADFQMERDLRDAYQAAFWLLKHDVESFLYKANMTPPWESAGAVWGQMVQRLNNGLIEAQSRIDKSSDLKETNK